MNPAGIRRLHELAVAACEQQPMTRAEVLALFDHLRNLPRQNRMVRVGDLFRDAPNAGVATGGQAAPGGLGPRSEPGDRD